MTALPSGRLFEHISFAGPVLPAHSMEVILMAFGIQGSHGNHGRYHAGRSRRRRSGRRRSRQSDFKSEVRKFLGSRAFTDAMLGAFAGIPGGPKGMLGGAVAGALGRGGWRSRRPPREEGQGHPGGWMSRGKRRGY